MDDRGAQEVHAVRDADEWRAPARSGVLRLDRDGTIVETRGSLVTDRTRRDSPAAWLASITDDIAELCAAARKSDPLADPRVVVLPDRPLPNELPNEVPTHVELVAVADADDEVLVLVRDVSGRERAHAREAALAALTSDVAFVVRPDGIIVTATGPASRLLGAAVEGRDLSEFVVAEDRVRFLELLAAPRRRTVPLVLRLVGRDGAARALEMRSNPAAGDELVLCGHDVTAARAEAALLAAHRAVLEHLNGARPLGHALDAIARAVETGAPGGRAAVYVRRDDDLRLGAAPSLRSRWSRAARRLPLPDDAEAIGPVPLPGPLAVLAAEQGFGAGWLQVSRSPRGGTVGAVVLVSEGPRRFTSGSERDTLLAASELAGVAIAHEAGASGAAAGRLAPAPVRSRRELVDELAGRATDRVVTVLVHVERLAEVNRRFGYAEGDRLLDVVVDAMRPVVRANDVIGRLGGATFAVVGSLRRGSEGGLARRLQAALPTEVALGAGAEAVPVRVVLMEAASGAGEPPLDVLSRAESQLAAERERAQVPAPHSDNNRETIAPEGARSGERR